MSYEQKLLKGMSENPLTQDACNRLIRGLDAIPEVFHSDFLSAYFKEKETEELPEDYAVVKTFDLPVFHIGDEVIDENGVKGIFAGIYDENEISVVYATGGADCWESNKWHRTGRNFPAISAILEELKKA